MLASPEKSLPLLIASLGGHVAHDDDHARFASACGRDRRRLDRHPAIAAPLTALCDLADRAIAQEALLAAGGRVEAGDLVRRERAPLLVPHAESSEQLGGGGAQIGKTDRAGDRRVGVDQAASRVANRDSVRERAQDRLQLLAGPFERLQRRHLRLLAVKHQADLVAEGGHQMQRRLVDRAGLAGVELDDRGDGLSLADWKSGDRTQPRGRRQLHPRARILGAKLLDPDGLAPGRSAPGGILAQLQHRSARRLDDRRSDDRLFRPDRPAVQRRPRPRHPRRHHPVNRQRPVELRGQRPKNLCHRLVERGVLQQNAGSGLLHREPSCVVGLGTPTHRRHFNDESRGCFPPAKKLTQSCAAKHPATRPRRARPCLVRESGAD